MTLEEYADALNLEIVIRRYPNQGNRYTAQFARCETKTSADSSVIEGTYGNGPAPFASLRDYLDKIKGKVLVVDAMSKAERREYVVPETLTIS